MEGTTTTLHRRLTYLYCTNYSGVVLGKWHCAAIPYAKPSAVLGSRLLLDHADNGGSGCRTAAGILRQTTGRPGGTAVPGSVPAGCAVAFWA